MSTPSFFSRNKNSPSIPRGEVLMTVDTNAEAQSVVNRLSETDFAITNIAIVGRDLVTVEYITGRITYAKIAMRGAINGAWAGLVAAVVSTVISGDASALFVPAAVVIGAGIGMIFSLVARSLRKRRQNFQSVEEIIASKYDIVVPNGVGDAARAALNSAPNATN
ncbi:MAG: general stress protein [Microbacteriaceae bacterium]